MATTGYRLTASTGIHKGDREYQQDQVALLKHPRVNGCLLAVVADGMGGRPDNCLNATTRTPMMPLQP